MKSWLRSKLMQYRRDMLVWHLGGLDGHLDECDYAERNIRDRRQALMDRKAAIARTLARMDAGEMLAGPARVVVG